MARISPPPGVQTDLPPVNPGPFWAHGVNIRFRLAQLESVDLFGPVVDYTGAPIVLDGSAIADPLTIDKFRSFFPTPDDAVAIVLAATANRVSRLSFDPLTPPGSPDVRWRVDDVTPVGLPVAIDAVPNPSTGRIIIPPTWAFDDDDETVVAIRTNDVSVTPFSWDRSASVLAPLVGAPVGAVACGIVDRILILAGCESYTAPSPSRFMTVRWSARFDYTDFVPTALNESGELQLEGGSRIVGGGNTRFGFMVWTDKRAVVFIPTGDPASVFDRKYVDGSIGLLANKAWVEAGARVWYLGEDRNLYAYDGGPPRPIPNPLRMATIERVSDAQAARIYMVSHPEFNEVHIWYPDTADPAFPQDDPNTALVYNYVENAWSLWRFDRTAYTQRFGIVSSMMIQSDGTWLKHLDASLPAKYTVPPGMPVSLQAPAPIAPLAAAVTPFSFACFTNIMTAPTVTEATWRLSRVHFDYMAISAVGATDDITLRATGYGEARPDPPSLIEDAKTVPVGTLAVDLRVSGKGIQFGLVAEDVKTYIRLGGIAFTGEDESGER